ncbi:MAG: hydroxypyruvate isomerase [Rhodoferax sp.]
MPHFAANLTMLWPDRPFLDRFEAAARAGFKAVEFLFPYDHPPERVAQALQAHGLQLVLHNLPPGDWAAGERGLACIPGREAEFRDSVAQAAAYAPALGVRRWHCMAGIPPPGVSAAQARDTWVRNVRFAAAQAKALGVALLIEAINPVDMPGYFVQRPRQAMALIHDVRADGVTDNVWLQYDVYHAQRTEGELTQTLRALLPHIGHIQIADTPGRHEPGTGEIAYPFLLAQLDALGYRGWVGCEYHPRDTRPGGTERGLAWLSAFQEP